MYKKWISIFLVTLLVLSNFNLPISSANTTSNEETTDTLYVKNMGETRELSPMKGTEASPDLIPLSKEPVEYVIENVNGNYKGDGNGQVQLYVNGLATGSAVHAKVSYDFNGDGNWDRTEITQDYMPTDGNINPGDYEAFTRELFSENDAQQAHQTFTNGRISLRVWVELGTGDMELKVNAPEEASHIVLPYELENSGAAPDEPDTEDPGTGEKPSEDPVTIPDEHYEDWELLWNDEFDGTAVDNTKWGFQNGTGAEYGLDGWGNDEQQYYQEENATVDDGKLIIEAKKETVGNKPYTSTRLFTAPTFAKKYGKFEAAIKLPKGDGLWPAFWMMPKDSVYGEWASSGEIDIMEARGRIPNEIGGTIHYGGNWPNNTFSGGAYEFEEGDDITNYHVYSVEWEPGEIRWYVDGELYHTETKWDSIGANQPAKYAFPAPFDQEFYIILNLAVGGTFDGGRTPDDADLPAQMEVDYVRVYELTGRDYKEAVEPVVEKEDLPGDAKQPTADGNLIYDTAYEQGFTEITTDTEPLDTTYWNFAHISTFGGDGSISTEALGGTTFAKVDITQPGSQTHSIQLLQNVTLGVGRQYKVSFDAKADGNRNINVKLGGGASRGWGVYSGNETFALTNEVDSYEFSFQMTDETDPLARLEMNLGTNANTVWIGNVRVEEVEVSTDPFNENVPKEPLGNGNHVYNGTFDVGAMDRMTYWDFTTDGANADATVDPDSRELHINMTEGGADQNQVMLTQTGINLLQDNDYELTFDGAADANRDLKVQLISQDGATIYGEQTINLTTSMSTHSFSFAMSEETDINGQLVFLLGGNNSNVTLDNIELIRTTDNIDYSDIDIFPLDNGDFSDGLTAWESYFHNDGAAGNTAVDNEASVTSVTNVGNEPWSIQLFQAGMDFSKSIDYILSFDAKSTQNRTIGAVLENTSYTRYVDEAVELSNEMQTYSFEFEMPNDDAADLKFLLGNIDGSNTIGNHDIVIDNVVLEVKNAPYKRAPSIAGDTTDAMIGQPIELTFNDDQAWRDKITAIKMDDQAIDAADYQIESGKLTLAADLFTKAALYKIVIEAEGYASAIVEQNVNAGDGNLIRNGDFANGTQSWSSWSGEGGSSTFSVSEGAAQVDINALGAFDYANQFFQDGLDLEAGKEYELSFNASSSMERPVLVELHGQGSERLNFQFTEDTQAFTHTFIATSDTKKLNFLLGDVVNGDVTTPSEAHTVTFDDFVLKEVVEEEPDKNWVEIGENLILDGTFDTTTEFGNGDNPVEGWNIHNQGDFEAWAGLANFLVEDGELNVTVEQVGWAWWQIQLFQNMQVPAGTYKLSFDAQSEHTRPISVELAGNDLKTFTISNTMKNYQAILEVSETGEKQLIFGLGRGANDPELQTPYSMIFDNIKLVEVEEDAGPGDPGTEDPGTEDPGTEDPGTEDPGTEDPGTEDPGTEDPGTEDPGTEDPGTEDPGTEDPGTEDPGTEDPGTEDPGTEDPGTEDQGTEDPGTEDPGTEDPGPEDPGPEDPGTEDPGTEDPGTEDPGTEDPGTDKQGENDDELPDTASPIYNLLLLGTILLVIGGVAWRFRFKRS
ncbi:carbohydrate binding domain-containing protein [Aquibacillus koreensis]|uniref:Carbohydrate binding domain-containing protein n=1 Tax=Aquibacillus koreensis TaxID=279446 RepID=A0A9X3WJC5_9BACI|nr:carbohydrate binding domain-containing protein [Aquibacillus koreensis]MCT2536644.1 carbohydrate binding domain-containing protein [Aquibacillus koreensis]MDC3419983.1 carbohydrate binding domain-containing protein [Aquibacillus koreensis]